MFGFLRKRSGSDLIGECHARTVAASREPALYTTLSLPDTVEGRFESLTLHVLLVLRRLRALPAPAGEAAQELVDTVFTHLEVALRESGVGDFGVPKRMKKLGRAFYDRTATYDPMLDAGDDAALAASIAARVEAQPDSLLDFARHLLLSEKRLAVADLDAVLAGPPFPNPVRSPGMLAEVQT
jgi:cytochrome b pre-mRNA-processing protein 3